MGECLQAPRRLFVVCGRAAPEGLLQRAFAAVGSLEGLRLLREKGCCYVRYERASAALKAIETLHGAVLDHQPEDGGRPLRIRLKVLPAEEPGRSRGSNRGSKGSSGRLSGDSGHTGHTAGSLDSQAQQEDPDNVPPWSRLFVVCPRDADGVRIAASMGGYGALEYCKTDLIASKGVAYVKYFRASAALAALEDVVVRGGDVAGYKVKVMLAEPKTRRVRPRDDSQELESPGVALGSGETLQGEHAGSVPAAGATPEGTPRGNRLFVVIPRSVTQGLLARLFANSPGLQNCEIKFDKTGNSKGVAFVSFNTAEEAEHAKDELDGLLVTSKQRIKIMFAEPSNHRAGQVMFPAAKPLRPPPSSGKGEEVERDREPAEMPRPERRDVAAVRDSLANMSMPPTRGREKAETDEPSWEADQRAAQPVSSSDSGTLGQLTKARRARASAPSSRREWERASTTQDDSKLFTILSRPLPDYALHYVFSKFGTIEYVRLLRDKRYGHVKFESAACARNALHELNGTEILGERLKVAVADPVKDSRKRPRLAEGPGAR